MRAGFTIVAARFQKRVDFELHSYQIKNCKEKEGKATSKHQFWSSQVGYLYNTLEHFYMLRVHELFLGARYHMH